MNGNPNKFKHTSTHKSIDHDSSDQVSGGAAKDDKLTIYQPSITRQAFEAAIIVAVGYFVLLEVLAYFSIKNAVASAVINFMMFFLLMYLILDRYDRQTQ